MYKNIRQRGQIALVVLLVMAGALTLGMAVSKRAVVETRIDKDEELLKQAFNAAESGIDQYLGTGNADNYLSGDGLSSAKVSVTDLGTGDLIDFGETIQANKTEVFWLVGHDGDGNIDWSHYTGTKVNLCLTSSFGGGIKVVYFYKDTDGIKVMRWVYGGGVENAPDLNFGLTTGCATGQTRVMEIDTSTTDPIMVVVTPIGGGVKMSLVSDGTDFKPQGKLVTSTGSSESGVNVTVKRQIRWNSSLINYMLEPLQSETSISN